MWDGAGSPGGDRRARRPRANERSGGDRAFRRRGLSAHTETSSPTISAGKTNVIGLPRRSGDESLARKGRSGTGQRAGARRNSDVSVSRMSTRRRPNARSPRFCRRARRVVGATRTERGRCVRARALRRYADFDDVRGEQLRTEAMRSLDRRHRIFGSCRRVETAHADRGGDGRQTLGADRSALDRRRARGRGRGLPRGPRAPGSCGVVAPLHAVARARRARSSTRSTSAARCSIALRRRWAAFAAASRRRKPTRAIASTRSSSSAKYAKAIQDRIVTIRDGRFVIPIKAEFAGSSRHRPRYELERADAFRRAARGARSEQPRAHAADRRGARGAAHSRGALARGGQHAARDRGQRRNAGAVSICSRRRPSSRARTDGSRAGVERRRRA